MRGAGSGTPGGIGAAAATARWQRPTSLCLATTPSSRRWQACPHAQSIAFATAHPLSMLSPTRESTSSASSSSSAVSSLAPGSLASAAQLPAPRAPGAGQSTAESSWARTQSAPTVHRVRPRRRHRTRPRTRRPAGLVEPSAANDLDMSAPNNDSIERPPLASPVVADVRRGSAFYRHRNASETSIDSAVLLDHREQQSMRPRRSSTAGLRAPSGLNVGSVQRTSTLPTAMEGASILRASAGWGRRSGLGRSYHDGVDDDGDSDDENVSDTTPLVRPVRNSRPSTVADSNPFFKIDPSTAGAGGYGSVNNPPSVPNSPKLEPHGEVASGHGDYDLTMGPGRDRDLIINMDDTILDNRAYPSSSPPTPPHVTGPLLRGTNQVAEEDVCFPVDDGLSDEDLATLHGGNYQRSRPRMRNWPELSILEEWSREEKEERSEGIRAKKMPEPVYVGGRLRPPVRSLWHRDELESPYRFTYFNEELAATIHSHTISELLQPGQSFKDLFRPEQRVLEDSSDEESLHESLRPSLNPSLPERAASRVSNRADQENRTTPPEPSGSLPRLGTRPTFWLDVLSPTDTEMKVLSKTFGIHPLTVEDIMMQETREKVELFRSYYLVSYRTFEHDSNSEDFLEPVNIYAVVFREGVISFHFSMTPHPANVRRRIRQLKDYITVSADWISYALIDDITDAFAPLIQALETEVDDIDDAILRMHLSSDSSSSSSSSSPAMPSVPSQLVPPASSGNGSEKAKSISDQTSDDQKSDGEMLKRVGDARRKVMGLYRLMGNKADVIKGFAKRCNEQWEVAPRSEIGLYLGDIQDHIVTMVGNLNHMEKILSRSHSNYLAQINIKMNERQEQTADVLGRLTVLGTIVLPMNIITGLWGMNVLVPGQDVDSLTWFWCITAGLLVFGGLCYLIAKRVYKIM